MNIESTFDNQTFEELILEENKKNKKEIFKFFYEGKKYWVKKARPTSSNIFHIFFYKLISLDVLLPVENKTSKEAMLFETDKLIEFNENNINSAKVIGRNNILFVLEDCGQNIYYHLKDKNISKNEKQDALEQTINSLAKIHNSGFYHGGAQIRNFTYFNNSVHTIDLEDSFDKGVSLETLQFRDFLLFLLSLLKLSGKYEIDFNEIIYKYVYITKNEEFIKRLRQTALKFSFLIPLGVLLKGILSKDANSFVDFLKILKSLEER